MSVTDYLEENPRPFHIYRSSAGSGKTFTLAQSYLMLALSKPNAFRHILGVTFTNKATEEMKSRIVAILKQLAKGEDHPMTGTLCSILSINASELQKRASATLSDILHQYGRFSVVTIDSFFHQVIRSFAREMGLQGSFTIDLDLDKVLQLVIDQMLLEIGDEKQKELRDWLTQFAENKVEEGRSWDFRRDISSLGKEILKDNFKAHSSKVLEVSKQPGFFKSLGKELNEARFSFERKLAKMAGDVIARLEKENIDPTSFTRGFSGPVGVFYKLVSDDPKRFDITDPRRAAADDKSKWLKKADLGDVRLNAALDEFVMPEYQRVIQYIDQHETDYYSALEVLRFFYAFGILSEINRYMQHYRDENDVMLIADLPDFLHQIIQESDTPYIYEKVGSNFNHYLIDEFQDTSAFQWDNFKPLIKNATDEGNFCMVVGDVKQSIYRFRGGDWDLLQNKIKDDIGTYQVEEQTLGVNWRSSARLIAFNNLFFKSLQETSKAYFEETTTDISDVNIQDNVLDTIRNVFATFNDVEQKIPDHQKQDHGSITCQFIDDDQSDEEGWREEAIRQTIYQVEDLQKNGYELRDIAILTRYTGEGKKVADAFIEYRNSELANPELDYEVVSSEALYLTSSHLVRFIVSLIKWMNDEKNTIFLSEWLYEYVHYLKKSEKESQQIFSAIYDWKRLVPGEFVQQKGYLKTLPLYELVENIARIFSLDKLREEFTYLQGFQDAVLDYSKNERGDIPSFLDWWEEVRKERAIQIADENNAVKILTIHKAKGLEFPVVIIPFLSWSLDHDPIKDNILWCEDIDRAPFDKLPVVPLKYSKKLVKTYWAEAYYQERLKAYLDNINLLYVAFTRPVEVLHVFGKLPKSSAKSSSVGDLVHQYLSELPEWDESNNQFRAGEVSHPIKENLPTLEFGLAHYQSSPWRGKVSVQIKGSAELSEATFTEATKRGIILHQLLSRIKYRDDLDNFSALQERVELTQVVEHPNLSDWFDAKWQVDTEVPILLPGGDFKRIDRVNRSDSQTIVIDYKTGSQRDKDKTQVKEYMDIINEMGYPGIKGYLVYLKDLEIVEVA